MEKVNSSLITFLQTSPLTLLMAKRPLLLLHVLVVGEEVDNWEDSFDILMI
jgi:hypothetical protein